MLTPGIGSIAYPEEEASARKRLPLASWALAPNDMLMPGIGSIAYPEKCCNAAVTCARWTQTTCKPDLHCDHEAPSPQSCLWYTHAHSRWEPLLFLLARSGCPRQCDGNAPFRNLQPIFLIFPPALFLHLRLGCRSQRGGCGPSPNPQLLFWQTFPPALIFHLPARACAYAHKLCVCFICSRAHMQAHVRRCQCLVRTTAARDQDHGTL